MVGALSLRPARRYRGMASLSRALTSPLTHAECGTSTRAACPGCTGRRGRERSKQSQAA